MGGHVSSGPLVAFEAGYVRWLVERGYRPGAVADRLGQFRALSRWRALTGTRSPNWTQARATSSWTPGVRPATGPMWRPRACGCRRST